MECYFYMKNTQIHLLNKQKPVLKKTLEFKMNKRMQFFSISPLINLNEEGKWSLAVNSSEATNSSCNLTNENNSFSITIPGHWKPNLLQKLLTN